jgi:WD40 repeat protein
MKLKRSISWIFALLVVLVTSLYAQEEDLGPIFTSALAVSSSNDVIALARSPDICLPSEAPREQLNLYATRLLDIETGQQIDQVLGTACPIADLEWNHDGERLAIATAQRNGTFIVDVNTHQTVGARGTGGTGGPRNGGVAWSSDDQHIATFSYGIMLVSIYDSVITSDRILYIRDVDNANVTAIDWSNADNYLAVADFDGTVQIWNMQHVNSPQLIVEHNLGTNTLAWSPDDSLLALGVEDLLLVNPLTGDVINTLSGHTDIIVDIKWSPDGQLIASGGLDNVIRIWDASTGAELTSYATNTRRPLFDWNSDSSKLIYAIDSDSDPIVVVDAPIVSLPMPTPTSAQNQP